MSEQVLALRVSLVDPQTGKGYGSEVSIREIETSLPLDEFVKRWVLPTVAHSLAQFKRESPDV